jgi:predicted amidohydrolase
LTKFRAACVQLNAGDEVVANIVAASALIRAAKDQGAEFIATPEMTNVMENRTADLRAKARVESEDEALMRLRDLAAELGIHLLIGSLAIKVEDDDAGRLANRSFLIGPEGQILARYDKLHMFDVDLPSGETYRESRNYRPGEAAQLAHTSLAPIGMTICYDVRFPALYRALAQAGAQVMTVPSAFTRVTGEAHWHVLLRARAIECGAFVIAPAQCGTHPRGRETYGHSLIVSPWGEVLADGGILPGIALADIDLDQVHEARTRVPSLRHDRIFALPVAS